MTAKTAGRKANPPMTRWNPLPLPDDDEIPEMELPPQEVRVRTLNAEPREGSNRVRVSVDLTPFQQRPNLAVTIVDAGGQEAASIYIVETMDSRFSLTMHLRGADLRGPYTLNAEVSYPEIGQVHQAQVVFDIESPSG